MTVTIDNVIDSIVSPQTTRQPIPEAILKARAVLGYSGGNSWPTFDPYEKARPDLAKIHHVVPVTLSCTAFGHCYDIEAGGGKNENIGAFMHNAIHVWKTPLLWGLPWLYTFASNVAAMTAWARRFGYQQGRDYYVLAAHPNSRFGEHICRPNLCGFPSSDGTQHLFAGAIDASIVSAYMLAHAAPPKLDVYSIFPIDVHAPHLANKGNERLTVEQADGALRHPHLYHAYLKHIVRPRLKAYRDRLWRVSWYKPPDFTVKRAKADWDEHGFRRGTRWQLIDQRIKAIDRLG